ncbi:hypothetical protein [Chloroflexus sp.]|uniref:hypothetical protein n=1 Tax=Chloroflexus sp. TaxID=1904827 RepID=UPI002ACD75AF|nr:hypothetical protein [Chloroflexus sp.]MCX7859032.1 hypothetical protein [Chloroflexus sp.]
MLNPNSRYYRIATAVYVAPDGRESVYLRRRFLPAGAAMPLLAEVEVTGGDRLDLIAARVFGDPEQFWRICDANDAMNPFELTDEIGRLLRVAVPTFEG